MLIIEACSNYDTVLRGRSHITLSAEGGKCFQMLTVDYGGGGGLAVDYVIKI